MARIKLKGLHKATAKGRTYWYAWRGGPRLRGEPGSPEFMASYNEAVESRRTPEPGRFKSLLVLYRASADYKKLADSTRRSQTDWHRHSFERRRRRALIVTCIFTICAE